MWLKCLFQPPNQHSWEYSGHPPFKSPTAAIVWCYLAITCPNSNLARLQEVNVLINQIGICLTSKPKAYPEIAMSSSCNSQLHLGGTKLGALTPVVRCMCSLTLSHLKHHHSQQQCSICTVTYWRSQQTGCCSFCSTAIPTILVLISQKINLKTFFAKKSLIPERKKSQGNSADSENHRKEEKKNQSVASIISKCDNFHDTLSSLNYQISMPLSVFHVTLTGLGAQEAQMSVHCSRQANC